MMDRRIPWLVVIGALVLTLLIYLPGLRGSFVHDDFGFIVDNLDVHVTRLQLDQWIRAAVSVPAGHVGRSLTVLSLAANHYFTGLDPYWMKATNLAIHAANGIALFLMLRALFALRRFLHLPGSGAGEHRDDLTAAGLMALWLILPIQLTVVLYVCQRLESLSNLFVLLGLAGYLHARLRFARDGRGLAGMTIALVTFSGIGILAKESALLLPLYAACIEYCICGFRSREGHWQRGILVLYGLLLVAPLLAGLAWLAMRLGGDTIPARQFTTGERLMSEARVLVEYLRWTLLPLRNDLSLYHDDIAISRGLLAPATTLAGMIALAALLGIALWQRSRRPMFCLGILWFFAAHSLTGTIIPLELAYEHRNYFASAGLLLALGSLALLEPLRGLHPRAAATIACIAAAFYAGSTMLRAFTWSNPMMQAQVQAAQRPSSISAQYELGRALVAAAKGQPDSPLIESARRAYTNCLDIPGPDILCDQGILVLPNQTGSQESVWADLMLRLRLAPPSQNSISALSNLWECQKQGFCEERTDRLRGAFDAAMAHPSPPARLLGTLADFEWGALDRAAEAEQHLRRAVHIAPSDAAYRFNLIQLLIDTQRFDAARVEIDALRTSAVLGTRDDLARELTAQADDTERRHRASGPP